ncbi:MAG: hypothetical protein J6M56_04300 [Clostridia bacterium]|nr:hypothetical protein [Clostridia bacterium]
MMGRRVTLDLDEQTLDKLDALADSLGFTQEMAAIYAIRLVSACVEEGLLADVPARAWPREAQLLTGTGGKVIEFYARREKNAKESD